MSEFAEESARKRELRQRTEERTRKPEPSPEHPSWISGLHATTGNRGVSRVLATPGALQGMRLSPSLSLATVSRMIAQREGEIDEEEMMAKHSDAAIAQREEAPEEEEEMMAKHSDAAIAQREEAPEEEIAAKHEPSATLGAEGGSLDDGAASQIESLRGGGSPLDSTIQAKAESHFGADFSGVRVHQDPSSDALAASMSARAFTTGSDVFLRQGERAGDTNLLGHELTHVVQQSAGESDGGQGMRVGASNDPLEAEADHESMLMNSGGTSRMLDDQGHAH